MDNRHSVPKFGEPVILAGSEIQYMEQYNCSKLCFTSYSAYKHALHQLETLDDEILSNMAVVLPKHPNSWISFSINTVVTTVRSMAVISRENGHTDGEWWFADFWKSETGNIIAGNYLDIPTIRYTFEGIPLTVFSPSWYDNNCASRHSADIKLDTIILYQNSLCECWWHANIDNKIIQASLGQLNDIARSLLNGHDLWDDAISLAAYIVWQALRIRPDFVPDVMEGHILQSDLFDNIVSFSDFFGRGTQNWHIYCAICTRLINADIITVNDATIHAAKFAKDAESFFGNSNYNDYFWQLRRYRMAAIHAFVKAWRVVCQDIVDIITSYVWPCLHISEIPIEELTYENTDTRKSHDVYKFMEPLIAHQFEKNIA